MGALNFIWDTKEIKLDNKIKLFLAILVNFVLQNGEIWSGNKADLQALDTLMHISIRRILHIRMLQVKDERIINDNIRKKSRNIKRLSHIWRVQLLKFMGRVIRQLIQALLQIYIQYHVLLVKENAEDHLEPIKMLLLKVFACSYQVCL